MRDYRNSNLYPNRSNIEYYEQGSWEPPQTSPPSIHQTQYYERAFQEPPRPLPPFDQRTLVPSSIDNRVFGYESHPNLPQPRYSSSEPPHQHTAHLHGSGFVQVQPTPQRWDSDAATQFPPHSDARGRTPGLHSNTRLSDPSARDQPCPSPQKRTQTCISISDPSKERSPKRPTRTHLLTTSVALRWSAGRSAPDADANASPTHRTTFPTFIHTIPKPADSKTKPTTGTINERKPLTFYERHERQTYS
ncbi:hypothetical protein FA13DRAFT_1791502 [Coprinellus micaceus]|uniref:Uncharacterized protein n=1 Tax=Coprinellus micaceus TaxID=71717 RepID=A0A4Y7TAQ1_COPMI|nr:hypothetical protein FA13DRAFT_1791502 [Coprinellus micaceus]